MVNVSHAYFANARFANRAYRGATKTRHKSYDFDLVSRRHANAEQTIKKNIPKHIKRKYLRIYVWGSMGQDSSPCHEHEMELAWLEFCDFIQLLSDREREKKSEWESDIIKCEKGVTAT